MAFKARTARAYLKPSLAHNQRRRETSRAGHLRVCVDGEERWRCHPGVGVHGPFTVPLSTSSLEIFGDDDGALLLEVFPLPRPESVEGEREPHISVTVGGGQMVAINMSLGDDTGGEGREYVIYLTYGESPAADTQGAESPCAGGA
jgi:hypothetical protein